MECEQQDNRQSGFEAMKIEEAIPAPESSHGYIPTPSVYIPNPVNSPNTCTPGRPLAQILEPSLVFAPIHIEPQTEPGKQNDQEISQSTKSYNLVIKSEDGHIQEVELELTLEKTDSQENIGGEVKCEKEVSYNTHDGQQNGVYDITWKEENTEIELTVESNDIEPNQSVPGGWERRDVLDIKSEKQHVTDTHEESIFYGRNKTSNVQDEDTLEMNSSGETIMGNVNHELSNIHDVQEADGQNGNHLQDGQAKMSLISVDIKEGDSSDKDELDLNHFTIPKDEINKAKQNLCTVCGRVFALWKTLKTHQLRHTGEKPFECGVCHRSFRYFSSLSSHRRLHTGERPYKCNDCGKDFAQKKTRDVHHQMHTGEKPFQCLLCNRSFRQSGSLRVHLMVHSGEKPHKCNLCPMAFNRSYLLKLHTRTHTGEKPYTCEVCGQKFSLSNSLTKHRNLHTGSFKCKICDKSYNSSDSLRKHQSTVHTRVRPVKEHCVHMCPVCGRKYNLLSSCKKHYQKTHAEKMPYTCAFCDKGFLDPEVLAKHHLLHAAKKPHKCCICGMTFALARNLKSHRDRHSGEKSYKCSMCEMEFSVRSSLVKHEHTHTEVKTHQCSVCNKRLTTANSLRKHQHLHTVVPLMF